jgi:hypothetical protein
VKDKFGDVLRSVHFKAGDRFGIGTLSEELLRDATVAATNEEAYTLQIKTKELLRVVPDDTIQDILDSQMADTVHQIDHFKRLDFDFVQVLAAHFSCEVIGAQGTLIWSQSNPKPFHYHVVSGQVCVVAGEKGGNRLTPISSRHALLGPLEYFGPWAVKQDNELGQHGLEWKFVSHSRKVLDCTRLH